MARRPSSPAYATVWNRWSRKIIRRRDLKIGDWTSERKKRKTTTRNVVLTRWQHCLYGFNVSGESFLFRPESITTTRRRRRYIVAVVVRHTRGRARGRTKEEKEPVTPSRGVRRLSGTRRIPYARYTHVINNNNNNSRRTAINIGRYTRARAT